RAGGRRRVRTRPRPRSRAGAAPIPRPVTRPVTRTTRAKPSNTTDPMTNAPTLEQRQHAAEAMLRDASVMPVLTVDSVEQGLRSVEALLAGGLRTIELVLRTPAALDALAAIKERHPGARVGAGTVLEPAQVDAVEELGADFI